MADDLIIKEKVPDRNGDFAVKCQIFIAEIKNDGLVEEVFEYEYFRGLSLGLSTAIAVKIEGEMNFVDGILADLVSENIVLVNDSF